MILDIACLVVLLLFFIRGYTQGFIVAVFSLLAVLAGIACALKLSHTAAAFLSARGIITASWGLLLSYVILFFLAMWLVRLGANLIEKMFRTTPIGILNNLCGAVLYTVSGVIVWSACLWLADRAHLLSPELTARSYTFDYILPVAPWAFDSLGVIWPLAKDLFGHLEAFFLQVNQKLDGYVGTH